MDQLIRREWDADAGLALTPWYQQAEESRS
jgi:hypothetical protein